MTTFQVYRSDGTTLTVSLYDEMTDNARMEHARILAAYENASVAVFDGLRLVTEIDR